MKKNKIIIFITSEMILLTILIMIMSSTQAKQEQAKSKLEQAVNKSYIEDKLDAQSLKNNIENGIKGASVKNKQTTQFPMQAVVDGYQFKVEENGSVESIESIQEPKEDTTILEPTIEKQESPAIIKYKNDTKTDKGIKCTIDDKGIIELNGRAKDNLYIKISNGMEITSDGTSTSKFAISEPILFSNGKKLQVNVKEIEGRIISDNTKQEFNVVTKYQNGEIAIKNKILNKNV